MMQVEVGGGWLCISSLMNITQRMLGLFMVALVAKSLFCVDVNVCLNFFVFTLQFLWCIFRNAAVCLSVYNIMYVSSICNVAQ